MRYSLSVCFCSNAHLPPILTSAMVEGKARVGFTAQMAPGCSYVLIGP
jgi:hypothetical protein